MIYKAPTSIKNQGTNKWSRICYQNFSYPTWSALTYLVSEGVDC